jgi:hypothetical protein
MPLNEPQKAALLTFVSSDAFRAAEAEVGRLMESSLSGMLAPEAAIQMAMEKGSRLTFRFLRELAMPTPQRDPVKLSGGLTRNSRP